METKLSNQNEEDYSNVFSQISGNKKMGGTIVRFTICLFVDNVNKTNYQACKKKYSKPEQEKVSVIILNH